MLFCRPLIFLKSTYNSFIVIIPIMDCLSLRGEGGGARFIVVVDEVLFLSVYVFMFIFVGYKNC